MVDKKDAAVEKGNVVAVTYAEVDDAGEEKAGTRREGFSFEVGTGFNLYGLDEDVVGLPVGAEKTVDKSYPEDYQYQELAGKTVKVKLKVESIREKNLPAIDDELAQDINEKFETLEDLKADIRSRLDEAAKVSLEIAAAMKEQTEGTRSAADALQRIVAATEDIGERTKDQERRTADMGEALVDTVRRLADLVAESRRQAASVAALRESFSAVRSQVDRTTAAARDLDQEISRFRA